MFLYFYFHKEIECFTINLKLSLTAFQISQDLDNSYATILYEWLEREKLGQLGSAIAENIQLIPQHEQQLLMSFYQSFVNFQLKIDEFKFMHNHYVYPMFQEKVILPAKSIAKHFAKSHHASLDEKERPVLNKALEDARNWREIIGKCYYSVKKMYVPAKDTQIFSIIDIVIKALNTKPSDPERQTKIDLMADTLTAINGKFAKLPAAMNNLVEETNMTNAIKYCFEFNMDYVKAQLELVLREINKPHAAADSTTDSHTGHGHAAEAKQTEARQTETNGSEAKQPEANASQANVDGEKKKEKERFKDYYNSISEITAAGSVYQKPKTVEED